MNPEYEREIGRLVSDSPEMFNDARNWFLRQGAEAAASLAAALDLYRRSPVVVARIVRLLGEIGAFDVVVKHFDAALSAGDPTVLEGAIEALSGFRTEASIAALTRALESENRDARRHAAIVLGRMRDPRAVPALGRVLASPDQGTRYVAAQSLREIGTPEALALVAEKEA